MRQCRILAPCAMLGYGFPKGSFLKGMELKPDAIVVDAGSTDAGPHKLGAGVGIVSEMAYKLDLASLIEGSVKADIPLIIGSAGGSGAIPHVQWTKRIIDEILAENNIKEKRVAIIWADIPKKIIKERMNENKVETLGLTVKELTPERLKKTNSVVAQMGHEPIVKALEEGADIIICGRAYDPAPFAAVAIHKGADAAFAYHAGKILECGAICAEPGTGKDCVLGIIDENGFTIRPINPKLKCTKESVAAHTFYEKDHPYILHGPGVVLNLKKCEFKETGDGSVRVTGSKIDFPSIYKIKLEGAMLVGFRTFVIAGIRDEYTIANIDHIEKGVVEQVKDYYSGIDKESYEINFINYGINGVMGDLEYVTELPHEIGVIIEAIANTQQLADAICATARSTFLHYGYKGRKSTAGNLAFPFAPSDVSFGAVYEFSVYHLMEVSDGMEMFDIEYYEV